MATPATPAHLHPPSPPSQTPVVDFSLLERQKENIQPLRSGRSASALQTVFSAPRADRVAALAQGHAKHKAEIAAVEEAEEGDGHEDPLDVYVKYVKWVIDSYPAGQTVESGIVPLIEKATRRFKDDVRYMGDLRYLKLWIAYAGYVHEPPVIFQYLLANDIGVGHAVLYEEYAGSLERIGRRAEADAAFLLGIHRKAQPVNRLPSRYAEFQKRMLHADLTITAGTGSTGLDGPAASHRPALASRSVLGSAQSLSSGPAVSAAAHSNAGISVFVDPEQTAAGQETNEWPDVGTMASVVKENTQAARPWKDEKLKMRGPAVSGVAATPARKVEVFRDEDESIRLRTPSGPPPEDVFSRSAKPSEDQQLRADPFKYYTRTTVVAGTTSPTQGLAESSIAPILAIRPSRASSIPKPTSTAPPKHFPTFVPPIVPEKLRLAPGTSKSGKPEVIRIDLESMYKDGREWSLDEMRARRKGILGKAWEEEAPAVSVTPTPEGMKDVVEPLKGESSPAATKNGRDRDRTMRLDAPTINTRAALDDVYGLFNTSPAKSDQDEPPSLFAAPPAPTPSHLPVARHDENATARKASGLLAQARTPLTTFGHSMQALPPIMATPTPAQGSLARSSSKTAIFELHIDEDEIIPEPVKGQQKPFEVFTESTPASDSRKPLSIRPLELVVREQERSSEPIRDEQKPRSATKQFEIFVDDTVHSVSSAQPRKSLDAVKPFAVFNDEAHSVPPSGAQPVESKKTGRTSLEGLAEDLFARPAKRFVPCVEPPKDPTEEPTTRSTSAAAVSPEPPSAAVSDKPKALSFIDEADAKSVRPILPEEDHDSGKRPFLPFTESPARPSNASATASALTDPFESSTQRTQKPQMVSLPPRPELAKLVTAAAQLESENEQDGEDDPPVPRAWTEADEERWMAQQEQERQARRNARLGNFAIMTPITERTCEFTQTGSVLGINDTRQDDDEDKATVSLTSYNARQWHERLNEEDEVVRDFEVSIAEDVPESPSETPPVEGEDEDLVVVHVPVCDPSTGLPPNPCNPFDSSIMSVILTKLAPLDTDPNFHDLRPSRANKMEDLQKYTKKLAKRTGNTTSAFSDERFPLSLGRDSFSVREKLGEGGFGAVFLATKEPDEEDYTVLLDDYDDDSNDNVVAIKIENPCNLWECVILQRLQDVLPDRARQSIICPRSMYAYADESFLVLDFCGQGTLLDAVNRSSMAASGSNSLGMEELLVMFFTIELIRFLEAIHTAGFIHGDMKIDNCLLRLEDVPGGFNAWSSSYDRSGEGGWSYKGIRMIDFGRAIDTRLFPAQQTYVGDWPTDQRDCIELRENRPWTYQTDYFGLAGIIYCMLFGKYIETTVVPLEDGTGHCYRLGSPLKRYWQCDLWARLFDLLLNPCAMREGGELPVTTELAAIRTDMEVWLEANCDKAGKSLKGMLKKIELAVLDRRRR